MQASCSLHSNEKRADNNEIKTATYLVNDIKKNKVGERNRK